MLNSHSNPECGTCKFSKLVGFGTKVVDSRRTHINIYNCMFDNDNPLPEVCPLKKPTSVNVSQSVETD